MTLIVSLLAIHAAISAAVTLSSDDAPVRRVSKAATVSDDEWMPVRRQGAEAVFDDEPLDEAVSLSEENEENEVLSVTKLHKYWPHCQAFGDVNWNTAGKGAEQHFKKMTFVPNVQSALACGQLCGSYSHMHNGNNIPCAGWTWVAQEWATEFTGHKSCALFGFMENDAGVVRYPIYEYTFANKCCIAGTPCQAKETITDYNSTSDRVGAAWRKAERARLSHIKQEHLAAEHDAKIEAAKPFSARSIKYKTLFVIAAVLVLGVIMGFVFAWNKGYLKQAYKGFFA
jgi:hypothetical protein